VTLFLAAWGTQKENSATKPVVISRISVTAVLGGLTEASASR